MSSVAIADYAMIGNCQSAALVSKAGSIDWWCAPRFDSPAIFARLLDDRAGHFAIVPAGVERVERRYVPGSLVLETTMTCATGTFVLADQLAFGRGEKGHEIGLAAPALVIRALRCTSGSVVAEVDVAVRPEFGLVVPLVEISKRRILIRGGSEVLILSCAGGEPRVSEGTVRLRFELRAGDERFIGLERVSAVEAEPAAWSQRKLARRFAQTVDGWQSWSAMHQSYEGRYRDLVHHGGRILQALTYAPTGSIVAAPTTSLPEVAGGDLNWDYRFAWIRDATFTMNALWFAACPDEAQRFFRWLAFSAGGGRIDGNLQIVYGVRGDHDLTERELPHLRGWRGCRPVRIGNAAWEQRQIDVYGEIAGAAYRFRDQIEHLGEAGRTFVIGAIERAADLWTEPGHGIWEDRHDEKHYVHSKLMCWQALQTGIALADELQTRDRVERWAATRDAIATAIRRDGWSDAKRSYVQSFGSDTLDAAALLLVMCGFLSPDDPRAMETVDTIARELSDGVLLRRYSGKDEQGFVICSFWLAHALAILGRIDDAREIFERTAAQANDVGLLAEQIDLKNGEQLGNFPQAFSHVGLINAAVAIDVAARSATDATGKFRS